MTAICLGSMNMFGSDDSATQILDQVSELSDTNVTPSEIQKFLDEIPGTLTRFAIKVVIAAIIVIIAVFVIRFVTGIIRKSLLRANADPGSVHFITSFIKVALEIFLAFCVASAFGVSTASIVALLGSAGVAIGLAVQGSLSNLAGGIMLMLLKPFKIGDYIVEDGGGHEGTVKEIGLFNTKLVTIDNRVVILPNGKLENSTIVNNTGNTQRMVEAKVGVGYSTDIKLAKKVLERAAEGSKFAVKDKEKLVFIEDFGSSSVDLVLRYWVETVNYIPAKREINERIFELFNEAKIVIPFPQVDVHMQED